MIELFNVPVEILRLHVIEYEVKLLFILMLSTAL
jgi:hypothetical protein